MNAMRPINYQYVSLYTLYDVLHDPQYRKSWDPYMLEAFDICRISPNSDIGYYASECYFLSLYRMFILALCRFLNQKVYL